MTSINANELKDTSLSVLANAKKALENEAFNQRNIAYLKVANPSFKSQSKRISKKLLEAINKLIKFGSSVGQTDDDMEVIDSVEFEDSEDLIDRYGEASLVVDSLLEAPDKILDKHWSRTAANDKVEIVSNNKDVSKVQIVADRKEGSFFNIENAARLPKPQFEFSVPVDNSNLTIWLPKLKTKPNAMVPMADTVPVTQLESLQIGNPYEYEIKNSTYPDFVFSKSEPQKYLGFANTPFEYIDTPAAFERLLSEIKGVEIIAVDIENHSLRSYQGFVCLIQISTRSKDYIIDAIALRDNLPKLNETFSDPNTLKVLHGADSDIVWLQRDFSVYIVNLFDTFHASKALEFDRHGLLHLMQRYCPEEAMSEQDKKRFQMSDWRLRPLPPRLLDYARSDTHYLLYIFDQLRNELLDASVNTIDNASAPLTQVLERSRQTSLQVYTKPQYNMDTGEGCGWRRDLMRIGGRSSVLTEEQIELFKVIHQWRDIISREEDESPFFLMTAQSMLSLVQKKPTDVAGVLSCCRPAVPAMRRNGADLAQLIQRTCKGFQEKREKLEAQATENPVKMEKAVHIVYNKDDNNLSKDIQGLWDLDC